MRTAGTGSFEQFAVEELPQLLAFAAVLTGSRDAAADTVQETMIRVALRWKRIGALEHPSAYVRRMVTNEWLGQHRRWFARSVKVTDDLTSVVAPAADFSGSADLRDDLRGRLLQLPHRQRAVLVLRHYLGLSDHEIAAELDCAIGTVRSLASRGAAALRFSFDRDGADPEAPIAAVRRFTPSMSPTTLKESP
ncbi:MAG: sigma-70 family RNA polymerase sigma factor [Nakamurella sp.]